MHPNIMAALAQPGSWPAGRLVKEPGSWPTPSP
jgi:hypothetical protein